MKQFFKFTFASLTALFLFVFLWFLFFIVVGSASGEETKVYNNSVLKLELSYPIQERLDKDPSPFEMLSILEQNKLGLDEILAQIKYAKADDRISGIYLNVSFLQAGYATTAEIRDALKDFKESGKWIYSYAEIYTQKSYYLASVADKVFINPVGFIEFKGINANVTFYKKALEKLGIKPEIIRHGKFKSAVEPFMLEKMSEENKEQIKKEIDAIWSELLSNVSAERGLSEAELNETANKQPFFNAEDAVANKLADKIVYKDELLSEIDMKLELNEEGQANFISIETYANAKGKKATSSRNQIAIIYAEGTIYNTSSESYTIDAQKLSMAINAARTNDRIKAIVLRINSPGGDALASDIIWREVELARQTKPVIASMGDVAASGGYYIAAAADTIIARPNTITGSIGVFGLLFTTEELLNDKLGITSDNVKTNTYADFGSLNRSFTDAEKQILQNNVENTYATFLKRVSAGRNLTIAEVDSIGQGRVWAGTDAIEIGLVDLLGGIDLALEIAAEKAGIKEYRIRQYPKQEKNPFFDILKTVNEDREAFLKKQLGEEYIHYKKIRAILDNHGVLAKMPYELVIE